mmetsp:Transcript_26461/g.41777  ORF Transcript_26461/g.41777 Transcript_26461/m.41777 type:complete len:266 (+) Transcript_26461:48-845(+)
MDYGSITRHTHDIVYTGSHITLHYFSCFLLQNYFSQINRLPSYHYFITSPCSIQIKYNIAKSNMVFLRLRPRSMFNSKRVATKESKRADEEMDKTLRLASSHSDNGDTSSHSDNDETSSSSPAPPPSSSLDKCVHTRRSTNQHVLDLIERRLANNESRSCTFKSSNSRVSFIDEELGLTPRHVVTHVYYRPRTTRDEKRKLFYSIRDFDIFKQEELYETIENEIREIERLTREHDLVDGRIDELNINKLIHRVDRYTRQINRGGV